MLKLSEESVNRYFDVLSVQGVTNQCDMYKLLTLVCIEDMLTHDYTGLLSQEDVYNCVKAVSFLSGSTCLIPYTSESDITVMQADELITFDFDGSSDVSVSDIVRRIEDIENTRIVFAD